MDSHSHYSWIHSTCSACGPYYYSLQVACLCDEGLLLHPEFHTMTPTSSHPRDHYHPEYPIQIPQNNLTHLLQRSQYDHLVYDRVWGRPERLLDCFNGTRSKWSTASTIERTCRASRVTDFDDCPINCCIVYNFHRFGVFSLQMSLKIDREGCDEITETIVETWKPFLRQQSVSRYTWIEIHMVPFGLVLHKVPLWVCPLVHSSE